ncbi:NADH-quinone oxidoreductase subunit K [Pseudomonas saliphila]|uniref:NADH-quinone oxidoreductase subunit K n=1 Tax=Pseudomonas saliphila TaxID=2586906 RepID=UPI00123C1871|nr:NADH-quinone oxidoreductase subunit K [Pseudomonas saliphila]
MSSTLIFLCAGSVLWLMGLHGLARLHHPIRRIMAINIMGSGTFMVMIALANRGEHSDPVLHALVVTGLVVAVSATAFALRLAVAISAHKSGKQQAPEPNE